MFARCPRIPVDCTLRIPQMNNDVKSLSPKSYAQSKVKELQEMYTQCAQNMLKRHKRNKKMYDKKCRGPREFQTGDKVLVRKHNPKNKIDDHYKAEIHVVIEKKHSNSVIYYVKGLETSIVKCYHQDYLILFKERDTVSKAITNVLDLPSWHDTRNTIVSDEPECVVKVAINKIVSTYFGNENNIEEDYKLNVDSKCNESFISSNMTAALTDGAKSIMIVLPTQQSICNKLDMILSTVRRAAESKKWDRIVVSASNSTIFIFFGKSPQRTIM